MKEYDVTSPIIGGALEYDQQLKYLKATVEVSVGF